MKYFEKLKLFEQGNLVADHDMEVAQLRSIEIDYPTYLIPVIFERGVSLQSPSIAALNTVFMGAHSYMNNGGYLRSQIFIGRFCSIGRRVTIGAAPHPMTGISTFPALWEGTGEKYDETLASILHIPLEKTPLTILENDVWVGDGAVILQGITIGTGAVIAANAVITKDVEPYSIMAGVPAKIIRKRFPDELITELLSSEYWEVPLPILKTMPLGNILQFIEQCKNNYWMKPVKYKSYRLKCL